MIQDKKRFFETNKQKASSKVTLNSIMMGGLFLILTLILTSNPSRFSALTIAQIVLAIPLLFVSNLAYSKVGYWEKIERWDTLGWFTNNIGSIFILDAVGLMVSSIYKNLAIFYFFLIIFLMAIYSIINVRYKPETLKEKTFKFLFFILILVLGGLIPTIFLF